MSALLFTEGRRVERDLVGERDLPLDARYGIHALRAAENFARSDAQVLRDLPEFCAAFGMVKLAAARANRESGAVPERIADAIALAADELIADRSGLRVGLIVPVVQGGAGTSTNMNVNEVLANRALEHLGHPPGAYDYCHPNDHVNRSQSTNDAYPTALRIALILRAASLEGAASRLEDVLRAVARHHDQTVKLGRTQLQDAVAMSVGDEFDAWADGIDAARRSLAGGRDGLLDVNLGGTAIGTGLTASRRYQELVVPWLAEISGIPVRRAAHPVSATTDPNGLLGYSAALRGLAVVLSKIANDLRLLSSGPRGGLAELHLPAVQSGSSMMPGKVNPVIPEFVNQLAFRAHGSDAVVTFALDAAQLQLNAMLPVVASELLRTQNDLTCAMDTLRTRCLTGIVVDEVHAAELARHDLGMLSTIAAEEGYATATDAAVRQQDPEAVPILPVSGRQSLAPEAHDRLTPRPKEDQWRN